MKISCALFRVPLLAICVFVSCGTLAERGASGAEAGTKNSADTLLTAYPEDGNLVIWGCAARQSTRARELELALSDAAWKAALFSGLKAASASWTLEENAFPGFSSAEKVKIIPDRGDDFSAYKSALRYNADDMRVIGNSVFLRCVYPAQINAGVFKIPKSSGGAKPAWIKTPPQNSGSFTFARGFAGRRSYTNDTLAAAYEDAIIAFAVQKNTHIQSRSREYTGQGQSLRSSETLETSAAAIASFFALEIFLDCKTGDVWILAAGMYNP